MSFLEFFVTNMEYTNLNSMWGLLRVLLWQIAKLLTKIGNAVEEIYNHIFSLFGIIYSEPVLRFLRGWINYLWIPIAVSILVLAYNLILGDSEQGNKKLKIFARNLSLLAIVIFGLPYLFLGHANDNYAAIFADENAPLYLSQYDNTYGVINATVPNATTFMGMTLPVDTRTSSNPGLIDFFINDNGRGLIRGVENLSGTNVNKSYSYSVLTNNVYDMHLIYHASCANLEPSDFTRTWTQDFLESGSIRRNEFQVISNNRFNGTNNDGIMYIDIGANSSKEYWENYYTGDLKSPSLYNVVVPGYDYPSSKWASTEEEYDDAIDYDFDVESGWRFWENIPGIGQSFQTIRLVYEANKYNSAQEEAEGVTATHRFLFTEVHNIASRNYDSSGSLQGVYYQDKGSTKLDLPFGLDIPLLDSRPFRYHVEWGVLFVQMIALILVLFLTSYKIARIIYELIFNHFLAIFFGAADLSNGQKIREVLMTIVNLLLSLLFAVVSVQLYFIITDAINTVQFLPNNPQFNKWMIALIDFFIAMATIKGPSVLERILHLDGGLGQAWNEMGRAIRPVRNAAMAAGYMASKGIRFGVNASKAGLHGAQRIRDRSVARNAARQSLSNGNQRTIGGISRNAQRAEKAGNPSQFSAIQKGKANGLVRGKGAQMSDTHAIKNLKNDQTPNAPKGIMPIDKLRTEGGLAANAEMARQGRDISKDINDRIAGFGANASARESIKSSVAEQYKSNIHNAALAEQAKSRYDNNLDSSKSIMSDEEALTKAYRSSGFSESESHRLAARDIHGGSYSEKKEKFENSISALAQEKYNGSTISFADELGAYREAATEHYQALGFDSDTSRHMAQETANRVMVEDKQEEIRRVASESMKVNSDLDDATALAEAARSILPEYGYHADSYNDVAEQILSNGSLKDGVSSGRISHNALREREERNTRASSLSSVGINSTRMQRREKHYENYLRSTEKKTEKKYRQLKRSRDDE